MAAGDPELSPATAARLRSLRWRVTALIALIATVAVTVFAVVVIRVDRQLRDEQLDAELLRRSDDAARLITFEDGVLDDGASGIDGVVLAVNPSFSIREFEEQQDIHGFPDPTDDELAARFEETFFDADLPTQEGLVAYALGEIELGDYIEFVEVEALVENQVLLVDPDDGELDAIEIFIDDVLEPLIETPPGELFDEAYRRWVIDQAEAADVELDFETALLGDRIGLSDTELFAAADQIVEEERSEYRTSAEGLALRATALRDGPQVRGAVIAFADPAGFDDDHAQLRTRVIVLAIAIVAGAVIAAWFVAGRTTRPTGVALAQQERFLADAAHELRTPIAAIRATAEAARPETSADSLARVAELAADASTLTDDLLTLARMDADRVELQRDRVRLDLLVESTIAAIPGAADAVAVEADEVVIDADPRLLERAIGNLIRNAIAHGGASPAAPAHIRVSVDDGTANVTVADHGPGIDPDVADALFQRFHSRTGSSGHGLGLPLARWIARAHGGDLVLMPVDDGATFRLTVA